MINEELEYASGDGSSELDYGESHGSELGYDDEDEYGRYPKYRKEQIFQPIDFTKLKTKIACTIGPASNDVPGLIRLFDAGMGIARFNMSHGTKKDNHTMVRKYFQAKKLRPYKTCALMLDLRGREIRQCKVTEPAEGIQFELGEKCKVREDRYVTGASTKEIIQVDSQQIMKCVRPGDLVSFEDGTVDALVLEVAEDEIVIQFKNAGVITGNKSVRISGQRLGDMPLLKVQDREDIEQIAKKYKFDYITIPNVTSVKDLQEAKQACGEDGKLGIIAKIDNLEAVHQFAFILKYADAVCIVRNELAFELPPDKLMIAQKWMVQTANMESVPIFVQSQVLETMISAETQGKEQIQETQEISNAVLDGCDGFILSHETSVGKKPLDSAILLAKSMAEAENIYDHEKAYEEARAVSETEGKNGKPTDMLCSTATQIALDNNVDLFICLTSTGGIARNLARQKPMQTILACSENSNVVRQANCTRGVIGYKVPAYLKQMAPSLLDKVLKVAKEQGYCLPGNKVMIFTCEDEGTDNETVSFRMIEIDED